MVGTAASTVIGAIGVIVIARLLGPGGYGVYTLAWALPALFLSIADVGVSPAVGRYAASLRAQRRYGKLASMIGSGLLFETITCSAALLFALGLSGPLATWILRRQEIGQLVALASLAILFEGIFSFSYSAFVGLDRMEQSAGITVLRESARVILSALLIVVGFGVAGAIAGQVLAWILVGLLGAWLLVVHRRVLRNTPGEIEARNGVAGDIQTMMSYGLPLYVGSLVGTVLEQYQNIVLAFFASNMEIGNFNAAVNFGALIGIVATPVATSLFPAFSKLDLQTREEELKRMFELSVKYTSLLILPVAVGVALLSKDLIRAVYGVAYGYASTYLTLYIGIFALTGLGYYVVGNFLNGVGRTKETLRISLVQLAIFLPAAPAMAWLYQVRGLIIALVLSALVATSFGLKLAIGKYGMRISLKGSLAALAAALASAVPVLPLAWYSPLPSFANVLVGAAIYLVAYLTFAPLFKAVRKTDLQIMSHILSQIWIIRPAVRAVLAYEALVLAVVHHETEEIG